MNPNPHEATLSARGEIAMADAPTARRGILEAARPYAELVRPGVMLLVVLTGVPGLVVGNEVFPSLGQALTLLLGTLLCGSSCSALNAVLERDLDARMTRTRLRPIPSGRLQVGHAVAFGLITGALSTGLLYAAGGLLTAAIGLGSILFYVGVYTAWLKRTTPLNIVIGGAAGSTAPLICDAGVDGVLGVAGLALFVLIFLWTPPHFWAVALYRRSEYDAAGVPMMPQVVGEAATRQRMLAYTLLLLPVGAVTSLVGITGIGFAAFTMACGLWFTWHQVRLLRRADDQTARKVFMASNVYLLLVVAALVTDGLWTQLGS